MPLAISVNKTQCIERNGLPLVSRVAAAAPATIDGEARTVELVWTSGAEVDRQSRRRQKQPGHRRIVRFSKRPEVDGLWQDLKDSIICSVSVVYPIHDFACSVAIHIDTLWRVPSAPTASPHRQCEWIAPAPLLESNRGYKS